MNALTQFIREMPKAEIHIHLEGAIQPETVLKLAQHNKLTDLLPSTDLNTLKKWFTFTDFRHFVQI
jgi:adenosine deaminase